MTARIIRADASEMGAVALEVLESGGLVVLPTDTVYGVGASIDRPDGVAKLYVAKGRPEQRAIPVLVSSIGSAERLASDLSDLASRLMMEFWPGALTIVVPAAAWLPKEIVRDTGCVGLRQPDHPAALTLIELSGGALAVTSANRSGEREALTAAEADEAIGDRVDLIIDAGRTPGGAPSTVVKVETDGSWRILREGSITSAEISRALHSDVSRSPRST
jgi:L-threonylcarbamoyladenylate synthase